MRQKDPGAGVHRGRNRRGIAPVTATIVLVVSVAIVGAVGFVLLGDLGHPHTTSSTAHSCVPSNSPMCASQGTSNVANTARAVADVPSRG